MSKRVLRFFRKKDLSAFSVMLHRGGSGGGVIESVPSQKWLESMQVLKKDGYMAYMRIVIDPYLTDGGYGGYPEFRLIFLPGNHNGVHNPTIDPSSSILLWEDNDFAHLLPCFNSKAFIVNTSLFDLEDLHKTIGKVIRDAKRKKAKPKS